MRKQSSLIFACLCVLPLAGCIGNDTNSLTGKWQAKVELADYINDSFSDIVTYMHVDSFKVPLFLVFNEDGSYTFSVDDAACETAAGTFHDALSHSIGTFIKGNQNLTDKELEELMSVQTATLDDLATTFMEEANFEEFYDGFCSSGQYVVQDQRVYLRMDGLSDADSRPTVPASPVESPVESAQSDNAAPTSSVTSASGLDNYFFTYELRGDTLTLTDKSITYKSFPKVFPIEFTREREF